MNKVYMAKVHYYHDDKLLDVDVLGAFKTYRSASAFLVGEGFEVYYDDDSSEMLGEETIGFHYCDELQEQLAFIEEFTIFD